MTAQPVHQNGEITGYSGVLFIAPSALQMFISSYEPGSIDSVHWEAATQAISIWWTTGRRETLAWGVIREKSGLLQLPLPKVAFLASPEKIGLLFHSATAHQGLFFREPHSIIRAIGTLTETGLQR